MRVHVSTLVDITQSGERRGNTTEAKQQANYNTLIQTLGLRILPELGAIEQSIKDCKGSNFGELYQSKHRVWEFDFEFNYEGGLTEEMLLDDFDLIPFIKGLTETASLPHAVFRTRDSAETNILFEFDK